jgi:hypothetical protein
MFQGNAYGNAIYEGILSLTVGIAMGDSMPAGQCELYN